MSSTFEARLGTTVFPCIDSDDVQELYCEKLTYHINKQVGDHCYVASVIKHPKPYYIANVGDALINMAEYDEHRKMIFIVMYGIEDEYIEDIKHILNKLQERAMYLNERPYFFIVDSKELVRRGERLIDMRRDIEDIKTKFNFKAS